jgi:hypothetical protein
MARYKTTFNLDLADLDTIERALRNDIARLSVKSAGTLADARTRAEIDALHRVLGRLHNQKIFFAQVNTPHVPAA